MKKILKKRIKSSENAVQYFSEELKLVDHPITEKRSPINGFATVCVVEVVKACQLG